MTTVLLLYLCLIVTSFVPQSFGFGRPHKSYNENPSKTCGYESCPVPKEGMLNLHLVPHTHDDVGWLKTVDQYYYGSKNYIQKAGVQYIIDSVIDALEHDANKKFIYVETAYLWKWWQEQHDHKRHQVKKFINNGQLEIIGGAWSMNDEAATHYHSIIDQFTWGLRRLNDTFGECARPKIGWQIDPFGHSREMASIFAQLGFDGLFFGRLDYQDKLKRLLDKKMEMVWRGSPNLGKSSDLFTSVLYNNYQAPAGFCFDVLCTDEPIIDDKKSPDYNVERRIKKFIQLAKIQANQYRTNNILLTMGEDFNYQDAHMWYKNLDKLIHYINEKQKDGSLVNAFYSTPSCYIKAVNDANMTWPSKTDDFFPYASDPHAFWTGYFTSRPTIKYFEREGNNMLQMCKQLTAMTDFQELTPPDQYKQLIALREAMGIMQHHDAVTGTEKQHVSNDYARILSDAMNQCLSITSDSLNKIFAQPSLDIQLKECPLNISQCDVSENSENFMVLIYNPSSQKLNKYIRIPVTGYKYRVTDPDGVELVTQILPIPEGVQSIPGRYSLAKNDLVFLASNLPPLGYKSYYISPTQTSLTTSSVPLPDSVIGNSNIQLELDKNGNIAYMVTPSVKIKFSQEYMYYEGAVGNNEEFENRSSGAYIFRPVGEPHSLKLEDVKLYKGPLVDEIHQVFSPWITNIVRIYANEKHVEFDWIVGPIPVEDGIGKEVITRFKTDLNTKGIFYTDSNGRELLRRERDKRDTWNITLKETVAGNYYPVTSRIVLIEEETNVRVAALNDRAQGGSSLLDGHIELMVHRRLLHDDAFGVAEALNETAYGSRGLVARGTHYVIGGNNSFSSPTLAAEEQMLAARTILHPRILFANMNNMSYDTYRKMIRTEFHGLSNMTGQFPANIQILTLEPWKHGRILLRLEHILEENEDPILSKPACINIEDLFATFKVVDVKETTLGANQWLSDSERLNWKSDLSKTPKLFPFNEFTNDHINLHYQRLLATNQINYMNTYFYNNYNCNGLRAKFEIVLKPKQIRTFILDISER